MKMLVAVLVAAALLVLGCAGSSGNQPTAQAPSGNVQNPAGVPPQGGSGLAGTKFSDWKYYPMAMKIAPGTISSGTQAALNVFSVRQSQQSDGSLLVTVTDSQDGTTNSFTLASGESLYFADGNPADDVGTQSDAALMDDHFVVVDSGGNIAQAYAAP